MECGCAGKPNVAKRDKCWQHLYELPCPRCKENEWHERKQALQLDRDRNLMKEKPQWQSRRGDKPTVIY